MKITAIVVREVLLRTSPLRPGKWFFFIVVCICLAFSAVYELAEWGAAVALGEAAHQFLGTQGDPWDTQWDMFGCACGAVGALLTLARAHDRGLAALTGDPPPGRQ